MFNADDDEKTTVKQVYSPQLHQNHCRKLLVPPLQTPPWTDVPSAASPLYNTRKTSLSKHTYPHIRKYIYKHTCIHTYACTQTQEYIYTNTFTQLPLLFKRLTRGNQPFITRKHKHIGILISKWHSIHNSTGNTRFFIRTSNFRLRLGCS